MVLSTFTLLGTIIHLKNSFHLAKLNLYPLNDNFYSHSPPSYLTINHHFTSSLKNLTSLGPPLLGESDSICPLVTDFGDNLIFSGFIHIATCIKILFLFKAESYSLYEYTTFCFTFICPWTMQLRLLLPFDYCDQSCYEHGCANTSSECAES